MSRKIKEQLDKIQPNQIEEEKTVKSPSPSSKAKDKSVENQEDAANQAPKPAEKKAEEVITPANTNENGERTNPQPIQNKGSPMPASTHKNDAEKTEIEQP